MSSLAKMSSMRLKMFLLIRVRVDLSKTWLYHIVVNLYLSQVRVKVHNYSHDVSITLLESKKEKKRKISTGEESENGNGSDRSSSSGGEKSKKKKKKSKHKKKDKHHRNKETKDVEQPTAETEDQPIQETTEKKKLSNEISGRDMMGLKMTIDPDEIPEIPQHKFLMRKINNETNETNETQ